MSPEFINAANTLKLTERWMTPFFRVSTVVPKKRRLEEFIAPFLESGLPVTIQLMGNRPETVAAAAAIFIELGAVGINLNFGCPSRKVTSGGAGGGALRNPADMVTMVKAVKAAIPASPLSVKLRSGWESPDEMQRILPLLVDTGCLSSIFLHFRTVSEQYRVVPGREKRFDDGIRLAPPVPVILNGDINSADDAVALLKRTGAAGVMCARGWMRDPLLLKRIRHYNEKESLLPTANEVRHQLFRLVLEKGFKTGRAIELSNFLWGKDNPFFEQLKRMSPAATVFVEDLYFR